MGFKFRKVYEQSNKSNKENKAFYVRLPSEWIERQFSDQEEKYVSLEFDKDSMIIKKVNIT